MRFTYLLSYLLVKSELLDELRRFLQNDHLPLKHMRRDVTMKSPNARVILRITISIFSMPTNNECDYLLQIDESLSNRNLFALDDLDQRRLDTP